MACRSFAGEALERERFGADVVASYHSGVGFAKAKANVESLNRYNHRELMPNGDAMHAMHTASACQ